MPSLDDYDVSVRIGQDLREVPNNRVEMTSAMKHLVDQLSLQNLNGKKRIQKLGLLGSYARILRQFKIAEAAINEAIKLSRREREYSHEVINLIRLAHIYQWREEYSESNQLFSELLQRTTAEPEVFHLEHYVVQHTGKNYFDQARYSVALEYFDRALALREEDGNEELIRSTEFAIEETKKRLGI